MVPFFVSGSYCSPISESINKRLFENAKADNTTTSAGCSYSCPVLSSTYITPFAFLLSLSYSTRRTYAPVRSSQLPCPSAHGTPVANGSDSELKSQPRLLQNERYYQ